MVRVSAPPDKATVQAVLADVLAHVGSDQMSELWSAIGDLLWAHYEPYQHLPEQEQKAWRAAFEAELNGGYEPETLSDAEVLGRARPDRPTGW